MAYTYPDLIADGSGRVVYYLIIPGVACVGTSETAPTDSWYTDTDLPYHPWLIHDSCGDISDSIDYLTAEAKAKQISVDVIDYDGGLLALTSNWRAQIHTYLTETLTSAATTATVEDTSAFPGSGDVCIGEERATYSGTTDTTFTGLDRDAYGTEPEEHFVDLTSEIPIQPIVTQSPSGITGRRALLYAAAVDPETGAIGAATCIYRGRITGRTRVGRGIYRISIKHAISAIYDASAGNAFGSATFVRGTYYTYFGTLNTIEFTAHDVVSHDLYTYEFSIGSGWRSHETLESDLNIGFEDTWGLSITAPAPYIHRSGDKFALTVYSLTRFDIDIVVQEGGPIWALGFDAGTYTVSGGGEYTFTAQNSPRALVVDFTDESWGGAAATIRIYTEGSGIETGKYVVVAGNPYVEVATIAAADTAGQSNVGLTMATLDDAWGGPRYWAVEDGDATEIQHCLPLAPDPGDHSIKTSLQRLLHLESGQAEPARWCALGVLSEDIDWTELDDCVGGILPLLDSVRHVITEPTTVYDAIGHHLALLGICPRITDDSKIGFVRISTPTRSDALALEVDSDQWDAQLAADVETELETSEVLKTVIISPGYNYTAEDPDYADKLTISWREGTTLLRSPRTIEYEIPGLVLPSFGVPAIEIKALINSYVLNTHFSGFGRENTVIEIPCTATAASIRCGDVVIVSHELLPNLARGELGVADEVAVVEARDYRHSRGRYSVTVRLGVQLPTGGIAPTARISSYDEATATATFSSAAVPEYAPAGGNDLAAFVSTGEIPVILIERDSVSPSVWHGVIASSGTDTSAKTVTFSSAPLTDGEWPAGGIWMIPETWSDAATMHQAYAYVAVLSTSPVLGSDDDPMVWTI